MAIPIIFIHYGNSNYLFYALWQAKQTNPESRIILLGDRQNAHLQPLLGIEHHFIHIYGDEAKQALKQYIHLSTNGEEFERFCLERWFILHAFLQANPDLEPCVYLDSDILIYASLNEPARDLQTFGMTMVAFSAHTNFVRSANDLGEFCRFIQSHYEDRSLRQWLQEHNTQFLKKHGAGGISDMTFFQKFRQQYPEKIATLCTPIGNLEPYAFDERLDTDDGGYELEKGFKKLTWDAGVPYCKNLVVNQTVKLLTLHFQGLNKHKMKIYLTNKGQWFVFKNLLNQGYIFKSKVINKLQKIANKRLIKLELV